MDFDPLKLALWTKHQQDWTESGLSLRAYCRQAGIGYSTFYTWRKRLSPDAVATPAKQAVIAEEQPAKLLFKPNSLTPSLAPLRLPSSTPTPPSITPNKLVPVSIKAGLPEMILHSPAGWQLIIPNTMDLSALTQLLRQLP